ncbi:MAG: SPFH domain-containing protein [Synechococcales bacterium]|nr:SPFH domain-containing protein [Synechococcales bacterium]
MGLFEKIRGEFIDIIEWLDNTNDTIAYRFERHQNEIKMGAKLTVRPGQQAVFVNEGQVADAFDPGMYELSTRNLPVLSTLQGWKYGFNSPFKAEVYFFSTRIFTNLKWGTANPIIIRDPEMGAVRLRAFGTYSIRVQDPTQLLQELISTDGLFQVDEISDQIRNMIMTSFATSLGEARIPLLDLSARYREVGDTIRRAMLEDVQRYGLDLTQLLIENISLPPEVEEALDKRASMGILGNMQQYAQFQAANAIEASANNPNGGGTPALDFGVGLAMGQQLMGAFAQQNQQAVQNMQQPMAPQPAAPPPPPPVVQWYLSRDGQNFGPYGSEQLIQAGLNRDSYVWRSGMTAWQRAQDVPEMAAILNTMPPPPPIA